ncbi:MAG: hypothetical protein OXE04_03305 [bacterium]|nr:hypothetical protein [bacterium]
MKTTIDIHDVLLEQAKHHAKETGQTLQAVMEDGLREVLCKPKPTKPYKLEDCRVGNPNEPNPLADYTWDELRDIIYETPNYEVNKEDS